MASEFGRAWGLSDRDEEVLAEVAYGVTLRSAVVGEWRGPHDPPRLMLEGGDGFARERAMIVSSYPARRTVVNGLAKDPDGVSFRYEGEDGGWLERRRVAWERDHVLGDDFESHLPGPPTVWTSAP